MHLLSKNARLEIIKVLLGSRSVKALAEELGVTPPAVLKYLSGRTHPSDATLMNAISCADGPELVEIFKIIIRELLSGLEDSVEDAIEAGALREDAAKRLESALLNLVARLRKCCRAS